MTNSISLPLPELASEIAAPPRCFVVFDDHGKARELVPFPFTPRNCALLAASIADPSEYCGHKPTWCATLWFPEDWPPGRLAEFLYKREYQLSLLD